MSIPLRKKAEEQALERIRNQRVASRTNTYTTKSGDTLGDIAKELGVTVSKLKEVNQNLVNIKSIPKGMKLNIPTSKIRIGNQDLRANKGMLVVSIDILKNKKKK
jgi:LysM repeat protein